MKTQGTHMKTQGTHMKTQEFQKRLRETRISRKTLRSPIEPFEVRKIQGKTRGRSGIPKKNQRDADQPEKYQKNPRKHDDYRGDPQERTGTIL